MPVVACCGLTVADLIQYVDRLPGPDEKVQARSATLDFGGPAANAAATAVALGAHTRLITALGSSPIATDLSRRLAGAGVEVFDATAGCDWPLPISSVAVQSNGQRSVISMNAAQSPESTPPAHALDGVDALLIDGHHLPLCLSAAHEAHTRGIPVLLDGGSWKPGLATLLDLVAAAVVSADFRMPDGTDVDSSAWAGRPVARTNGAEPIRYRFGRHSGEVAVAPVIAVDTLGAGDVFHGAWLTYVAEHGLSDFPAGLGYAARIATRSCRFPGARGWVER